MLITNAVVADVIAYRVDAVFRGERDRGCAEIRLRSLQPEAAKSAYVVVQIGDLYLYGCDANGHTYRMWEARP